MLCKHEENHIATKVNKDWITFGENIAHKLYQASWSAGFSILFELGSICFGVKPAALRL